ncbi:MAG: hypothetical protein ABR584_07660, partial [Candidatus Baltobacteraceae bacterium]
PSCEKGCQRAFKAFDMGDSDKAAIDKITARFFNAFTNHDGAVANIDCLHEIFMPGALIVKNLNGEPVIYDVDGFIEPRRAILTDGTLSQFCEREVSESTEIFRNVAHRFSRYEKSWTASGVAMRGAGAKVIQFIRTASGWKILSLAWDDDPA